MAATAAGAVVVALWVGDALHGHGRGRPWLQYHGSGGTGVPARANGGSAPAIMANGAKPVTPEVSQKLVPVKPQETGGRRVQPMAKARSQPGEKNEKPTTPRLDQFPSPRPLSEQEQMLARYVREFPQEAVLVARAQTERRKELEKLLADGPSKIDSDQQER